MNIAILGYGKMGRLVEKVAVAAGHSITVIIDSEEDWRAKVGDLRNADVAIDFSMPSVAARNIMRSFSNNVPIVAGTTGWLDKMGEIEEERKRVSGRLLYGANFSIGVNILFKINRQLAEMMDKYGDYSVAMRETHHIHKKDAPSGTAIHLAQDIIGCVDRLDNWKLADGETNVNVLPIEAVREGEVPGTHEIVWSSDVDCIELKHVAFNREGFARGAVMAAGWLVDRQPGTYEFSQVFDSIQ